MRLFSDGYSFHLFSVRLQHNAMNNNMNMLYFHSQQLTVFSPAVHLLGFVLQLTLPEAPKPEL
jgi:hypothetical protein